MATWRRRWSWRPQACARQPPTPQAQPTPLLPTLLPLPLTLLLLPPPLPPPQLPQLQQLLPPLTRRDHKGYHQAACLADGCW
jgi:hypothetical protein